MNNEQTGQEESLKDRMYNHIKSQPTSYGLKFPFLAMRIAAESCAEICQQGIDSLQAQVNKLQAFKDFVHRRLDEAGIEKEPNGEHSKVDCRIGDRLDIVLSPRRGELKDDFRKAIQQRFELSGSNPVGLDYLADHCVMICESEISKVKAEGEALAIGFVEWVMSNNYSGDNELNMWLCDWISSTQRECRNSEDLFSLYRESNKIK